MWKDVLDAINAGNAIRKDKVHDCVSKYMFEAVGRIPTDLGTDAVPAFGYFQNSRSRSKSGVRAGR
jgi:hypothetical protein